VQLLQSDVPLSSSIDIEDSSVQFAIRKVKMANFAGLGDIFHTFCAVDPMDSSDDLSSN